MPPKSRNFDGCWTCRSRKVKCDLKKPFCDRCKKAQLQCAGYKIILGWSAPLTISSKDKSLSYLLSKDSTKQDNFQRRNIEVVKFPDEMYYATYKELNNKIETLEYKAETLKDDTIRVGPFSVYNVNLNSEQLLTNDHGEFSNKKDQNDRTIPSIQLIQSIQSQNEEYGYTNKNKCIQRINSNLSDKTILTEGKSSMVHSELINFAKLTVLAIKGVDYKFNEQNMLHILYPNFFPNIDSDNWIANIKIIDRMLVMDNSDVKLKPLFKTLLNNFSSEVFTFLRIYYKHNYIENIIIPYVMQIIFEFICHNITYWKLFRFDEDKEVTIGELKEHIKLATIYLYLGLSAFKMSSQYNGLNNIPIGNDGSNLDEFLTISIELRKISMTIINYHLDEYDSNSSLSEKNDFEYEDLLLLALILQIQLDSYFSVYENFELIFAIGDFVIKNKYSGNTLSDFSKLLVEIFEYINIVFESTHSVNLFNYSIAESEQKTLYQDLNENYDLTRNEYDLDNDEGEDEDEDENNGNDNGNETDNESTNSLEEFDEKNNKEDSSNMDSIQIRRGLSKSIPQIGNIESFEPISFTINFSNNSPNKKDHIDFSSEPKPKKRRVQEVHIPRPQNNLSLEENAISLQFGLPKAFMKLFYEIIRLTNDKRIFQKKKQFPRNFPKICSEVEEKLINWNVNDHWKLYTVSYNSILNKQEKKFISDFHLCLFHYIKSFHLSIIAYFCQIIKDVSISDTIFQGYIKESLASYEYVINSKLDSCKFRPSFWVLLISGSNAIDLNLQKKVRYLCSNPHIIQPNYWRAKQIIFEVWKRREIGEECNWLDLVREWDIVLSLG